MEPSTRALAAAYRISRNTAVAAAVPSAAGMHIAAQLRIPLDETALLAEARKLGVQVHPLGPYYVRRPVKRGLIFGYGAIDEAAIAEGVKRLRHALRLVAVSL